MTKEGLKTIAFGHRRLSIDELEVLRSEFNVESADFTSEILKEITYVGVFGMVDQLRPSIRKSI
jgi:magnesium-transporting ATPase (P-type)